MTFHWYTFYLHKILNRSLWIATPLRVRYQNYFLNFTRNIKAFAQEVLHVTQDNFHVACVMTGCTKGNRIINFELGSHDIFKPDLKLNIQNKLSSNSHRSVCLCLPSTAIKGVHHHSWLENIIVESRNGH